MQPSIPPPRLRLILPGDSRVLGSPGPVWRSEAKVLPQGTLGYPGGCWH